MAGDEIHIARGSLVVKGVASRILFIRCRTKQGYLSVMWIDEQGWPNGWRLLLNIGRSIQIIQNTNDMSMHGICASSPPVVPRSIRPFQNFLCVSQEPHVQTTVQPSLLELWR